jgi:hypothetical protein
MPSLKRKLLFLIFRNIDEIMADNAKVDEHNYENFLGKEVLKQFKHGNF